jgi:hypothetical protein
MFDIANNTEFLNAIGINNAPEETKTKLINGIEALAEKRLIVKLSEVMTEEQAEEFSKITDEKQARDYLINAVPNFEDLVTETLAEIKDEILTHQAAVIG